MDYAAWKLFLDAADLGSLSKVAVTYGTSQPHISRQIGELEHQCGGRLFERTGRGVTLTELGQRIAPKVRAWLANSEQLLNDVRTSAGTPIGKVRIGSLPSTAHPLITTLYKRLKKQYPLVQLAVREGQGAQLRLGWKMAALISQFSFERELRPIMAISISSTRRPILSAPKVIGWHLGQKCRSQHCTTCRSCCFVGPAVGATALTNSPPSMAFR